MKKKMKPLDWGIWALIALAIVYIISPIDLDPMLEFTDNIVSLITMVLVFIEGKRRVI